DLTDVNRFRPENPIVAFAGCEGRDQAELSEIKAYLRGMHRRALVWLLASALGALGTADAFSAARHKATSQDRKKVADAVHHKRVPPHGKRAVEVEHHKHVIEQPADRDAAAPLPPDLVAAKQAIELVRRGKPKDATALAASIGDPVAAKLVEWARL